MTTHIYAFGSICRGDISLDSDVDLLAVITGHDARFDPHVFSIYGPARLMALWKEGNPFAWHLHSESKLLFASNKTDLIADLGCPAPYTAAEKDCFKFYSLFCEALNCFVDSLGSRTFDLSIMFLSVRNFSTCFQLGVAGVLDFARDSARRMKQHGLTVSEATYATLERARLLATRGRGTHLSDFHTEELVADLVSIAESMRRLSHATFGIEEFINRVSLQRRIVRAVNQSKQWKEELSGVTDEAIDRWAAANDIVAQDRAVKLLCEASKRLQCLATKSQDHLTGEYSESYRDVDAIIVDIQAAVVKSPPQPLLQGSRPEGHPSAE